MNDITQLFNTYFNCRKQFNEYGSKLFQHIIEDYPYIFKNLKVKYEQVKVTSNTLYLGYYDHSISLLNPYFEFPIPMDVVNNKDSSILEKWLQKKNEDEKSAFEFMQKTQKEAEYQEYLKLKNKFENNETNIEN